MLRKHPNRKKTDNDNRFVDSTRSKKKWSKPMLIVSPLFVFTAVWFAYLRNIVDDVYYVPDITNMDTITSRHFLECRSLLNADKVYRDNGHVSFRRTVTRPPFYISLHNKTIDHVRWGTIMGKGYYYETAMYDAIHEAVKPYENNPRSAIILDVGGNIGWFTLIAASLGHRVIAFEPNNINNIKLCESLQMNGWLREDKKLDLVELYEAGVGDKHGEVLDLYHFPGKANPGKATFSVSQRGTGRLVRSIALLSLDAIAEEKGWFKSRPNIVFLKVDVEGYEVNVLRGSSKMIAARLIQHMVFEYKPQMQVALGENLKLLQLLCNSGYELYKTGGANGPGDLFTRNYKNAEELVEILKEDPKKVHNQNLWWRLPRH